ncbi:MAG: glycerophosphodiester phosphodiesterase family protein, partial [Ilumatobacteraceae bacterium]
MAMSLLSSAKLLGGDNAGMELARHPYLDWPGPIAWAHRGGASDAPENTMPAFEYAVGLGYRYVETDVQVTADGVLVAFHDNDLQRTCGRAGRINEMTWSELSTVKVNDVAPIPLLEEMLGTWPELRINIDCKTNAAVDALVATIRRTNSAHRVLVAAFSDARLRRLRQRLGTDACTALGPAATAALKFGVLRHTPALAAQVPVRQGLLTVTDARFVARAHRAGVQVHVWT